MTEILDYDPNEGIIGRVVKSYADSKCLTDGKLDIRSARPFVWITSGDNNYYSLGDRIDKAGESWIEMEFGEVIERRRSIRRYRKTQIPRKQIMKVLEAGERHPLFHSQPWHFIVVEDEELKKRVADPQYWGADASVMIVVLGLETPEESDVHYPQYLDTIIEYHENRIYLLDIED